MAVNDPKEDGYDEDSEQLMEVVTTGEGDRTSVYLISYQDGSDELDSLANAVEFDDYESDKLENSIEMMSAREEDDDNWHVESDQSSYEASESPKTSTKRHTSQSSTKKVNVKLEPPDEETIQRNKELLDEQMRYVLPSHISYYLPEYDVHSHFVTISDNCMSYRTRLMDATGANCVHSSTTRSTRWHATWSGLTRCSNILPEKSYSTRAIPH